MSGQGGRSRTRALVVGAVVLGMVLAGIPLFSQSAAAATLVVDDDGAECTSAG
jgi:hypothetical protein